MNDGDGGEKCVRMYRACESLHQSLMEHENSENWCSLLKLKQNMMDWYELCFSLYTAAAAAVSYTYEWKDKRFELGFMFLSDDCRGFESEQKKIAIHKSAI